MAQQQADVNLTDEEKDLQDAKRRYKSAGRKLDQAEDALDQWKSTHPNHDILDPVLIRLEQQVKDAHQQLKDANQLLKDARIATETVTGNNQILGKTELEELIKVGQNLKDDDIVAGRIITVPKKVFGIECPNGLYIRQEYLDVHSLITAAVESGDSRVLVIGSPGIGKSTFGLFLFLLAIRDKKDVAYHPVDSQFIFYFSWNKNHYRITNAPLIGKEYNAYYDGNEYRGAISDPSWSVVFLFSSPRTRNYNVFVKQSCFTVYMNPWNKTECEKFAKIIQWKEQDDKGGWKEKFELVGGKPRYLFSDTSLDDLWNLVKQGIPSTIEELEQQVSCHARNVFDDRMKHIAFSLYRDDTSPDISSLKFSSTKVEARMEYRHQVTSSERFKRLL